MIVNIHDAGLKNRFLKPNPVGFLGVLLGFFGQAGKK